MASGKMPPAELGEKLRLVAQLADEIAADLDDSARACDHCGLQVRANMDDYQAKQGLDAVLSRIVRLREKLMAGEWKGRELAPVVNASDVRRGQ